MASEKDLNVYILGRTYDLLRNPSLEEIPPKEQQELFQGFRILEKYYEPILKKTLDHRIVDLKSFFEIKPYQEILELKDYFFKFDIPLIDFKKKKKEEEAKEERDDAGQEEAGSDEEVAVKKEEEIEEEKKKAPELAPQPTKEVSTVSPFTEELVKRYREIQADKLEENSKNTVANAVLRARKTWEAKNRNATILKNRTEKQKEADDRFFIETVHPKSESREEIYRNVTSIARQAVIAQAANLSLGLSPAQITKAVNDITYLGISGAVDITNFHDLNIVSQLAFRNQGVTITSPINNIDNVVQAWQHAIEVDPYSSKPDELEKEISTADKDSQSYFNTSTKNFQFRLNKNNLDLDNDLKAAAIESQLVQTKLLKAIRTTVTKAGISSAQSKELEKVLRLSDTTLQINPEGMGARTAAVIQTTNSSNRNISPEALRLYSIGLTPAKLDKMSSDPNSELSKFISSNPDYQSVFKQVRFHIGKIHESELGKQIKDGINPVSGVSAQITGFYNRMSPAAQSATKFILNPKGTIYAWANKKIGERIGKTLVKNAGSAAVQKLGNFLLEKGLKGGIESFAKATAEKLALQVATKIGVTVVGESLVATVAVALGISTAGASLLIGAILIVGMEVIKATLGQVKKGLDAVWVQLGWGDEFKMRDLAIPAVIAGTAAAGAGATFLATLSVTWRATQVAISSAIGIIIGAIVFAAFYVLMAFLVAPILSTLVQLDSLEKVDYSEYQITSSSGDCAWPTKGHYAVITGPNGGTHYKSKLEAIDLGAPLGSPFLASTDGVVTFEGVYSNYGNTVIIQTKNSAGSFTVYYAHLSAVSVRVGQQVKQGQQVGLVGGSGGWSAHIHMEYKGIKYNQCPAGGLQIKEGCCIPYPGGICTGACNAYSN